MFRRLALATPIAAALLLGGCVSGAPTISSIQSLAVAACGFLPTVETVANILAAGNPLITTGSAVANAICAAVTAAPTLGARKRATVPMVGKVEVHGRFVR